MLSVDRRSGAQSPYAIQSGRTQRVSRNTQCCQQSGWVAEWVSFAAMSAAVVLLTVFAVEQFLRVAL
jgi:hypothetical protein